MARRKSDASVGPFGVWAYNARDRLDLSVEAAVAALPTTYHPATLRKVEGGSARPGTRMWRELGALYERIADERGVELEPQPSLRPEAAPVSPDADLPAAIRELAEAIRSERAERLEWERGVVESLQALGRALAPLVDLSRVPRAGAPR